MPRILFDVGACDGSAFEQEFNQPGTVIYAFEPDKTMVEQILYRKIHGQVKNLNVFEVAISDVDGEAIFHHTNENGCGSLLPFAENINQKWQAGNVGKWGVFRNFAEIGQSNVRTIRLDTFMDMYKIPHIDVLHIDAQGYDLKVLESLGKYIDKVQSGDVESSTSTDTALYEGATNTQDAVRTWLMSHGFVIDNVVANDPFNFEQNLYFHRA